jgi:hypothetical protein
VEVDSDFVSSPTGPLEGHLKTNDRNHLYFLHSTTTTPNRSDSLTAEEQAIVSRKGKEDNFASMYYKTSPPAPPHVTTKDMLLDRLMGSSNIPSASKTSNQSGIQSSSGSGSGKVSNFIKNDEEILKEGLQQLHRKIQHLAPKSGYNRMNSTSSSPFGKAYDRSGKDNLLIDQEIERVSKIMSGVFQKK